MSWPTHGTSSCEARLSADPAPLSADGPGVRIHTVTSADLPPYRIAVESSRPRLAPWNPVNPHDLAYHLRMQSPTHRTFLVRAREADPVAGHDIVGKINVTNVVRARAHSGVLGYDAYDPYAGRGLFAEGMALLVGLALAPEPRGLGLNRVEAAVQPGNTRSAGLLRSLGFRRRGASPDYLWLADATGREAWRDHVLYGVTAGEWGAGPYPPPTGREPVVLVEPGVSDAGGPSGRAGLDAGCVALASELEASRLGPEQAAALAAGAVAADGTDGLAAFLAGARGAVVVALPPGLSGDAVLARAGLEVDRVLRLSGAQAAAAVDPSVACAHALAARALAAGPADSRGRVGDGRVDLAQ